MYLLAASLLAVLATLGLTVVICDALFGSPDLVYFVPFAAGVLLVSLGSDYNVFVVGRIWEEARTRPAREAVAVAAPRASRAITTAGIALAASFGLLAVIPLEQFRQMAIIMAVGVILDTVVVRSLLVPSLVALTGRAGMWPGHQRATEPAPPAAGADRRPLTQRSKSRPVCRTVPGLRLVSRCAPHGWEACPGSSRGLRSGVTRGPFGYDDFDLPGQRRAGVGGFAQALTGCSPAAFSTWFSGPRS